MSRGFTYVAAGIAVAIVLTAAFLPGRSTVGGIQAFGTATNSIFQGAEGQG